MGVPGADNDLRSAKLRLRARALLRRQLMSDSARGAAAASITERVLALPEVTSARVVAAYVGTGTELPTRPLLDALVLRGVRVLLPVLLPDDALAWGAYDGTLVEGRRGLLEPPERGETLASAGVVIVPGVAYDLAGRRLGRGGGSYDRALETGTAPVLALALDAEVVDEVPVEAHDRGVDVIVTPTRVVRVGR